jgi:hypothetical protein
MDDPIAEGEGQTPEETAADPQAQTAPDEADTRSGEPTQPDQPTAGTNVSAAAAVPTGGATVVRPGTARRGWYRTRWAMIAGVVAAGVVLFAGGVAMGNEIGEPDRDDFGNHGPGVFPGDRQHHQMPGGPGWDHHGDRAGDDDGHGRGRQPGFGRPDSPPWRDQQAPGARDDGTTPSPGQPPDGTRSQ